MKDQLALREHRDIAIEAVNALARMDAERLEELARRCRALDPGPERATSAALANQKRELAVLARVLEATRSNASVIRRLRASGSQDIEYRCEREDGWFVLRSGNGHDSSGV
jgi:hypothetical protein